MSHLVPMPAKPIAQNKVLSITSPKVKLLLVLMGLLVYVYILIFVKTLYVKGKRLERMAVMAMETEHLIHQVHTVDQNMAINMERLDDSLVDY